MRQVWIFQQDNDLKPNLKIGQRTHDQASHPSFLKRTL